MQLGELEKQVLHYLWQHPEADAKQVHAYFEKHRGGSLNTIQSTLERLFKKDLLSRTKQGHAYVYSSNIGREELIAQLIESITEDFVTEEDNTLLAAFSSVSKTLSEQQLEKLQSMIDQQRADRLKLGN